MRLTVYTWKDLVDHLVDFLGANPSAEARRDARRASLAALRELPSRHNWAYYMERHRLRLVAPYKTGTIAYQHTGGAYERMVTLTGGTWPSWAEYGTLLINNTPYEVESVKTNTILTLTSNTPIWSSVPAGTKYVLYRDTYALPSLFRAVCELVLVGESGMLVAEPPSTWLCRQRTYQGLNTPRTYCIRGDPNYVGTLAISFYPPPDKEYLVDMMTARRPRDLRIEEYAEGKASIASGSATLTGSGTQWTSSMIGSVVRLSAEGVQETPSGYAGNNPPALERMIVGFTSANSLTLDDVSPSTFNSVNYVISDPVDIELSTMMEAFLRCCEYQISLSRRSQEKAETLQAYTQALINAKEADARHLESTRVGGRYGWPSRLANMPLEWE